METTTRQQEPRSRRRRILVKAAIAVGILVVVVCAALVVGIVVFMGMVAYGMTHPTTDRDVRAYVEKKTDVGQLQAWATNLTKPGSAGVPGGDDTWMMDQSPVGLPRCLRGLDPAYVFVVNKGTRDAYVKIVVGRDPGGQYGILVGLPWFVTMGYSGEPRRLSTRGSPECTSGSPTEARTS